MKTKLSGFTLVEILVTLAIIGILTAIGVVTLTGAKEDVRKKKLEQDVVVVNNAIDAFLAAGGSSSQLTASNVIGALKQRVATSGPGDIVGPQGPFIDLTVITEPTDFEWSAVFTTSPGPRFVVEKSTAGVVFGHGPAMAVGGAAEREDAARPAWVWAYDDATPPTLPTAFVPTAVDAAAIPWTNAPVSTLQVPVISPESLTDNLWEFPLQVSIANPNPAGSSRVYYKANNGGYILHDGTPLSVGPGTTLTAIAVSLDPSRYYNSGESTATYQVIPFPLGVTVVAPGTMTYAQAGGLMVGQAQQSPATATLNIQDINQIPAPYLNSGNFNIRYTMDGSDPLTSGTAITGPAFQGYYSPIAIGLDLPTWGNNNALKVRAIAVATKTEWFTTSPVNEADITANRVTLGTPDVAPPNQIVSPSVTISMAQPSSGPVGMQIRYTTDNTAPTWNNGTLFTTNFILSAFGANEERFVQASTFPGSSENFMTNWFLPSAVVTRTYTGAAGFGTSLPAGVLVGSASLGNSGVLRGSVVVSRRDSQSDLPLTGSAVLKGNLYLPGTPTIYVGNTSANNSWTPARDGRSSWPAFSSFILGMEYGGDGKLVSPNSPGWSSAPRVIDLDGDPNPTDYHVLISGSSRVEGKIFRRADSPELPTVAAPPAKANKNNTSYGWGSVATVNPAPPTNSPASFTASSDSEITLQPGNYGAVKVQNTAKLILGDADNPENVKYYTFESLEAIGSSSIEVVGKVVITINFSAGKKAFTTANSSIVGNEDHPEYLQINIYSNASANEDVIHVNTSGAGAFYGQINAPKGQVKVGNSGQFKGSVTAYKMDMSGASGAGIEFNLPPIMD